MKKYLAFYFFVDFFIYSCSTQYNNLNSITVMIPKTTLGDNQHVPENVKLTTELSDLLCEFSPLSL